MLIYPEKTFFLRLAPDVIRQVNERGDEDRFQCARKAMVRCVLAKSFNILWECRQLFPKLQKIVKNYENRFNGEPFLGSVL